jgi:predicted dithiol-disulfide oxidoreductase (DUF899 family)
MALPDVVTCEQWPAARTELLAAEKRSRDTAFASRGWTVPWYSSEHSDFNYDFQVTVDKDHPEEDWEQPAGRAPRRHGADPTFTD